MLISASTSPVASTRSKALTVFEEIEKVYSEGPINIDYAHVEIPGTSTLNSNQIADNGLNTPNEQTRSTITPSTISTNLTVDEGFRYGDSKAVKRRGRKRNCKTNKRYIDYLSDDEDFFTFFNCDGADLDSDEWSGSETSENDDVGDIRTKKKKNSKSKQKKKVVVIIQEEPIVGEEGFRKEKKNSKKERQQKRFKGEEYVRKDGKTVNAKCLQPNPSSGKKCGNNCENISDERRQQVFDHFWKLTVDRRRDWLVNLTQKLAVKRKRTNSDTRVNTFKYHINEGEGRRVVCLQFLAATLDISAKSIYHTVKNSEWGCAKEDLRGKCIPPNKTKPDTIENVVKFIKSLPAVPSRYCRHDSSRVYLPQEFKNIPNVYSIYKKRLEGDGVDFVSEKVFRRIFTEEFNIGFHVPKKTSV
ncbi:unnamed protein product [Parnassius apollo]|uniref:(apollo) hypothetical protein n=1 Tax=Parnassius apollo TaxID=110799 RepID=A0A8S3XZW7_PARAO|nr:unnamed protein product [Parnassius apollo]